LAAGFAAAIAKGTLIAGTCNVTAGIPGTGQATTYRLTNLEVNDPIFKDGGEDPLAKLCGSTVNAGSSHDVAAWVSSRITLNETICTLLQGLVTRLRESRTADTVEDEVVVAGVPDPLALF